MKIGGQTAIIAIVTVLLCMVAVLTGFAFMKLSENGGDPPAYTISEITINGEPVEYSGFITFESYDESARESVYRFTFDFSAEGNTYSRQVTVIIDNTTNEPFGFVKTTHYGTWTDSNGTVLNVSDSGDILWIEIQMGNLAVKAHRSP